jgi:hypothetical protein
VREGRAQAKPVLDVLQLLPGWLRTLDVDAIQREIEGLKVALQL